jgi:hypothetical protein
MLSKTQTAIAENRSVFASKVKSVSEGMQPSERAIKKAINVKLGKRVSKGAFSGFPIFTLTLEERATCPTSCYHWNGCYGNHMRFATRYKPDSALIDQIQADLTELSRKHPKGFLVRLHILGDFYSVDYVNRWRSWLAEFPALHVYGYSARIDAADSISHALAFLREDMPERWHVRRSGDPLAPFSALSADTAEAQALLTAKQAFLCPAQTHADVTCGSCAACWASTKPVVFKTH